MIRNVSQALMRCKCWEIWETSGMDKLRTAQRNKYHDPIAEKQQQ